MKYCFLVFLVSAACQSVFSMQPIISPHLRNLIHAIENNDIRAVETILAESDKTLLNEKFSHEIFGDITPLLVAFVVHNDEIVSLLLAQGAQRGIYNEQGSQAIHYAAFCGHNQGIRELLAAGAHINEEDFDLRTPLHVAAYNGQDSCVKELLAVGAHIEAYDHEGGTPLHLAAANGQINSIDVLLSAGANLNAHDGKNGTPLLWSACSGKTVSLEELIRKGAQLEIREGDGATVLLGAASYGHLECLQNLLLAGAYKDAIDVHGRTPLHICAFEAESECLSILINAGANLSCKTHSGKNILQELFQSKKNDASKIRTLTSILETLWWPVSNERIKVARNRLFQFICSLHLMYKAKLQENNGNPQKIASYNGLLSKYLQTQIIVSSEQGRKDCALLLLSALRKGVLGTKTEPLFVEARKYLLFYLVRQVERDILKVSQCVEPGDDNLSWVRTCYSQLVQDALQKKISELDEVIKCRTGKRKFS